VNQSHLPRWKFTLTAAAALKPQARSTSAAPTMTKFSAPTQAGARSSHPAGGLQLFVTDLMKAGLGKDQIMTMGREVTGKLLMG
jgi:hypothetical protein